MGVAGHYAKSGDLYVRYEVIGDGPIDLLALSNGSSVWVDRDDEPHWSRFDQRPGLRTKSGNLDDCAAMLEVDPGTLVLTAYNRVIAGTVHGDRRLIADFRSRLIAI